MLRCCCGKLVVCVVVVVVVLCCVGTSLGAVITKELCRKERVVESTSDEKSVEGTRKEEAAGDKTPEAATPDSPASPNAAMRGLGSLMRKKSMDEPNSPPPEAKPKPRRRLCLSWLLYSYTKWLFACLGING